ncbi:DIE2/ALG10 family-domain-containing protein [Astrocystis sublimbata]|nr:DIE2/ALG10 family-domain-containing protein [Astrocystis sublimbata]
MSAAVTSDESSIWGLGWLIRFLDVFVIGWLFTRCSHYRGSSLSPAIALSCVVPLALAWLLTVTKHVSEPYLDEVFHIPQAQVYCQGRYYEWDDKITTPPGLYFATILYNQLMSFTCSLYNLRKFNVLVIASISTLALACKSQLSSRPTKPDAEDQVATRDILTGINIALFPVLFFFSGLYYTDPASTLVVLLAYSNHLARVDTEQPLFRNDVYTLVLGILALGFRQTNIFWVVVYMGGAEAIHAIKTLKPTPVETPKLETVSEQAKFYAWRYSLGDIHDPSVSLAGPFDAIFCVVSIGIAALCNLPLVLRRFIWPHSVVLASFAAFVAWNGGVVLGDKSNHVATIHLAQMLYIWPFFAFFSAPLFIPQLLNLAGTAYWSFSLSSLLSIRTAVTILLAGGAVVVSLLIVHFNTIIHPFTLADNRHYVFYVFRYSILRAWWIRYALAPVYIACAWMCWGALQGGEASSQVTQEKFIRSPFMPTPLKSKSQADRSDAKKISSTQDQTKLPVEAKAEARVAPESPATSTVLVLFLATSLSLMTAPLVEPRYFILPWVFWRLLIPATTVSIPNTRAGQSKQSSGKDGSGHVLVLLLETAWFVLINAATMYTFVTRPFYWRAPDGTLQDGGRVQRFMW